jgi:hypothetical protein
MNGPNKLEGYITIGWKGFPGINISGFFTVVSYEENEVLSTIWSQDKNIDKVCGFTSCLCFRFN